MVGDTILIKDISINGNNELTDTTKLSETLTDNTINALGVDASSRTIWVNGQPYGNAYVNIKEDNTVEAPIGAEIFNDFAHNVASGNYSHAEGYNTTASGEASHAEGIGTKAEGYFSHAEGINTEATGRYSHAEGYNTIASSFSSHAEGDGTTAIGTGCHAEGAGTKANANYAHAEGRGTTALGEASHAEGTDSTASGSSSHAEGSSTASGNYSHAEGFNATAPGANSHAEGASTTAEGTGCHAEGSGTIAKINASHAEGYKTEASSKYSHAEGNGTVAKGEAAHAEGIGTATTNAAEHAEGSYNKSIKNITIHSIGIGADNDNRKNAFEVYKTGDIYICDIGGYDGTNSQIDGIKTVQEVVEDIENTLTISINAENINYNDLKTLKKSGKLVPGTQYRITDYICTTTQKGTTHAEHVFDIIVTADSESALNEVARVILHTGDTYFANSNLNAWKIWYCLDNDTKRFAWADATNGKGVIYRMIDEFGNDCPYDFKNIQFYRKWDPSTSLHSSIPELNETNDFIPCYTFSSISDPNINTFTDNSLTSSTNVYSNIIKEYLDFSNKQTLNNICFFDGNIHNNTFGYNCYNSTIGDDCQYNTFGSNCYKNTFGNSCYSNTFGNDCSNNTFENDCNNNTFGNDCKNNTFENNCNNNTLGNACHFDALGQNGVGISFGSNCRDNIFGVDCSNNTFGNDCSNNTFGNDCNNNTFGNDCNNIKFASGPDSDSVKYNSYQYNQFGDGCHFILFKEIETSSVMYIQNYKFAQGLQGTSSTYLTVDGVRNRSFETYISRDTNGVIKESVIAELSNMVEISYGNLVALRDSSKLVPGQQYRITDYICTTTQEGTTHAEHVFDIIVAADSESALNEVARAIKHKGDTYFTNADANLNAWKIWYCLDNDINRFEWADATNGKGVIYRMIDEFGNDCPYDFKNIQFKHPNDERNYPYYYYTFASDNAEANTDNSLSISNKVYSNKILPCISGIKQSINRILFIGSECYGNTFGNDCCKNTFGSGCQYNTFENVCYTNTFGNNCTKNTFGHRCYKIILGNSCNNNIIGNEGFDITLGNDCNNNTFGNKCSVIKFTNGIDDNATKYDYYQYNHFGDGCNQILFQPDGTTSTTAQVQNYNFAEGLTPFSGMLIIKGKIGKEYDTTVSMDEDNTPHQFCLAQLFKQLGVLPITQS